MNLLPDEQLSLSLPEADGQEAASDKDIEEKYAKGEVRIVTEQARYPLNSIVTMLGTGDYNLNPEFQRRHRWHREKQSRLIESFIMNVPIPPIFLYEDKYSHYEVMDGLQRLTAISDFYSGAYSLVGLEQWPELNGRYYKTLPEQVRRGVDRRYLSSIILLQETAKSEHEAEILKQLVFERINSGGVQLEPQESRNAIYNGPLNKLCIRLARNQSLCKTWGIPSPSDEDNIDPDCLLQNEDYRKMIDVELVLRFFAHRQRRDLHKKRLRDYLDLYLKHGNSFPQHVLAGLEDLFTRTILLAHEVFGDNAFYLYRQRANGEWGWYRRPTTAVYDPLMSALSKNLHRADEIRTKAESFRQGIVAFYKRHYEDFEGRNTNRSILKVRDERFEEFIKAICG